MIARSDNIQHYSPVFCIIYLYTGKVVHILNLLVTVIDLHSILSAI